MKDVLSIYDEVEVLKTGRKSSVIEVNEYKSQLLKDGKIIVNHEIRYKLEGHFQSYREEELRYIGMKFKKSEEIDRIIVDALLSLNKIDYLKQLYNSEKEIQPDSVCGNCGGGMYEAFYPNDVVLHRCLDCGKLENK